MRMSIGRGLRRITCVFVAVAACSMVAGAADGDVVVRIDDTDGAAARARAPVSAEVTLSDALLEAAGDGRLQLVEVAAGVAAAAVPAQFEPDPATPSQGRIWWLMPPGKAGRREFRVTAAKDRPDSLVKLVHDEPTGAVDISHDGKPVLRYNFKMVQPPEKTRKIMKTNDYVRKYAIQRCDYIHPLYGPDGEVLTADFPHDHAHHRGVFWSWSDVIYKKEKRSIFALQGVFERPVCLRRLSDGPVFALIEAENVWKWDDIEPIVDEIAVIRVFPAGDGGRFIDFHFRFTSLVDGLEIHRGHCGSLIVRPARLADRETNIFEDLEGVAVRRCWGELSGTPVGGKQPVGMAIIPKNTNPYSPNTCKFSICLQSSFPSGKIGKRPIRNHPMPKGETLVLEYRLWVHPGRATEKELSDVWAAYNRPAQSGVKSNCK